MNHRNIFRFLICFSIITPLFFISTSHVHQLLINDLKHCFDAQLPESFGNTHFIVGFPHENIQHQKAVARDQQRLSSLNLESHHVLFSPDDDLQHVLIELINQEKRSIDIAIYTFTDKEIAQALIDAHARGVTIRVLVDPSQAHDRYSKIPNLRQAGIAIFEYNPNYLDDMRSNLMHHKFVIFSDRVWTGSFNFTNAARTRNQENAVILYGAQPVKSFLSQFALMTQQRTIACQEGTRINRSKGTLAIADKKPVTHKKKHKRIT